MPIHIIVLFVALIALIFMSAFFSASETAMMSINRYRLKTLVKNEQKSAILVDRFLQNPSKLLGTILLGNNLVNMAAASVTTVLAIELVGESGIAVATLMITIAILIFAEVPPKTFASIHPEKIAFTVAYPLYVVQVVTAPIVLMISKTSEMVLKIFKTSQAQAQNGDLTLEELRHVVIDSERFIPPKHREMLLRLMDLEKMTVSDIMVPRTQIELLDIEEDWDKLVDELATSHHGNIPVYRGNVNNIVGIASTRKILQLIHNNDLEDVEAFEATLKTPYFVPENANINLQLSIMQRDKHRTALVVDEYGDLLGLVTLEEILEEVIGDYTDIIPGINVNLTQHADGGYIVPGTLSVRDLNRKLNWELPYLDYAKTINGLILESHGSIPESGEVIYIDDFTINILKTNEKGIDTVKIFDKKQTVGASEVD